jgi:cell division protein FtsL
MVRILNFFCMTLLSVSILALYQISERTRVTGVELTTVERQIEEEQAKAALQQARYEHLARPDRIQELAEASLGMSDTSTVQLASLTLLPRKPARDAQVQSIAAPADPAGHTGAPMVVKIAARLGM